MIYNNVSAHDEKDDIIHDMLSTHDECGSNCLCAQQKANMQRQYKVGCRFRASGRDGLAEAREKVTVCHGTPSLLKAG